MCRFTLTQPAYIVAKFGLENFAPVEPEFYEPRFNVAPNARIVAVPTVDNQREVRWMRAEDDPQVRRRRRTASHYGRDGTLLT